MALAKAWMWPAVGVVTALATWGAGVAFNRHLQAQAVAAQAQRAVVGQALFEGAQALKGRMQGHEMDLPAEALRCINCHGEQATERPLLAAGADAASAAQNPRFAPRLDGANLNQLRPRRGGPPSRYSAEALCRLLRDGLDPAQVMIPVTMPRYAVSDADCDALWAFLSMR